MTTINGVTFNMRDLEVVATHRNVPNEQPGSDESFINDMGYAGLVLRITGFEETLAKYDEVISEFMKTGAQTLVYRTDWQFSVYSTRLVPMLDIGIVDNWFPYELIMITSTPYRESTTLSCRAKEITANNQEWSAEDIPCNNLLDNWSFEDWSAGASSAPDGWILNAGTVARSTTVKVGTYSVALTRSGTNAYMNYPISNYADYQNVEVTLGVWVKVSTTSVAFIRIRDSAGSTNSSYHTGGSGWEFLEVTRTVDASATWLRVEVHTDNTDTVAYFDGAVLVEGDSIPDNTFIRDIETDGSVDAVPDIQITNNITSMSVIEEYNALDNFPTGLTWDGSNIWSCDKGVDKIYKHNSNMTLNTQYNSPSTNVTGLTWDGTNIWSCDTGTAKIYKHNSDMSVNTEYAAPGTDPYGLTWDGTNIWSCDYPAQKIYKHNSDMTVNTQYDSPGAGITGLMWDGTNIWSCDATNNKIYKHNSDMSVNTEYAAPGSFIYGLTWDGHFPWSCDSTNDKIYKHAAIDSKITGVSIYNTYDETIKCGVANEILTSAIHRINTDGTGTIYYNDNFATDKWKGDSTYSDVTQDTINDELDIADDGYIFWKCDTKGPVTGIPTLTSQINITSGTPTIQISEDASTWYDITTAIVDDVDTVYELDSSSLHLKEVGATEFYWRFDCVKAGAATCSVKSFELDMDIITIDFEHPVINASGVSTFRCDQDADSGLNATVSLIYRARSWPA